jgi:hypothetical protein
MRIPSLNGKSVKEFAATFATVFYHHLIREEITAQAVKCLD